MINVEMTVRDAMEIAEKSKFCNPGLYERIVAALTVACSAAVVAAKSRVTVHTVLEGQFINCVKVFRLTTGFGLKESKDFFDVVRGPWASSGFAGCDGDGKSNSVTLETSKAKQLFDELGKLGCKVSIESV